MSRLRRHVLPVAAALFSLAVGIALGGGPLSYAPQDGVQPPAAGGSQDPTDPEGGEGDLAEAFADAVAERAYAGALLGRPTAIVVTPGVSQDRVDAMVAEVGRGGGGLTGVFVFSDSALDLGGASLVDTLGSQLMTQLDDSRIDPGAATFERLGQLTGLAVATPVKGGLRADDAAMTVRDALSTAELLTGPPDARLASLLLVLLPDSTDSDEDDLLAAEAVHSAFLRGLAVNAAGVVAIADTRSAESGLLAGLREDPSLTGTVSTVGGVERSVGRVVSVLALIASLQGSPGAYGASGSDGLPPVP